MTANAARILDAIQWRGSIGWQSLHSDMHEALEELKAAGLVQEIGRFLVL